LLCLIPSLASWHRCVFVKAAYTKCVRAVWAADGGQRESAPPPTRESSDALCLAACMRCLSARLQFSAHKNSTC
jgi:hypothetical protein